jgi:hypothetical protein
MGVRSRLLATLLLISGSSHAAPVLWGPEFTFTSPAYFAASTARNQVAKDRHARDLKARIIRFCADAGCQVLKSSATTTFVQLPDGTRVRFLSDKNVFEVSVQEMPISDWRRNEPLLEELIFGNMRREGMRPTSLYGSGHLNADVATAFGDDAAHAANFLADYFNHPGLADGLLEKDYYNALPAYLLPEESRAAVQKALEDARAGRMSLRELADALTLAYEKSGQALDRGHSLMIHAEGRRMRAEFRAMRAQESIAQFISEAEVFERRIAYIGEITRQGKRIAWDPTIGANHALQSVAQFHDYLLPLGLDEKSVARAILPARYHHLPVFDSATLRNSAPNPCSLFLKRWRRGLQTVVGEKFSD